MKVWNCVTGECVADVITNTSVSVGDVALLMGWRVNTPACEYDGGVWLDDLVLDYYDCDTYDAFVATLRALL